MATKTGLKSKVKAKAKAVKQKAKAVKAKVKGKVKRGTLAVLALALLPLCGCPSANPASRTTSAEVNRPYICVDVGSGVSNITVTASIDIHDLALASADSSGSTETQTATPTVDVRTRIDARYNDAIAGASSASRSVLGSIGDGITGVLDLMASKKSGKVSVTKTDGTAAVVECADGQCSFCEDCAEP